MGALTIANGFATIMGLIGLYRSEKTTREDDDYETFMAWLNTHRHEKVVELILDNGQIADSIRTALAEQHDVIMSQLGEMNGLLIQIARNVAGLRPLAEATFTESALSEQSLSIIQQMNERGASKLIESRTNYGVNLISDNQGERTITIDDERFLEDDVSLLVDLGFLRLTYNDRGGRVFYITRPGAALCPSTDC